MYEDFILKAKGEENPSLPTPLAQTETPPPPPQEKPATPQSNPLTVEKLPIPTDTPHPLPATTTETPDGEKPKNTPEQAKTYAKMYVTTLDFLCSFVCSIFSGYEASKYKPKWEDREDLKRSAQECFEEMRGGISPAFALILSTITTFGSVVLVAYADYKARKVMERREAERRQREQEAQQQQIAAAQRAAQERAAAEAEQKRLQEIEKGRELVQMQQQQIVIDRVTPVTPIVGINSAPKNKENIFDVTAEEFLTIREVTEQRNNFDLNEVGNYKMKADRTYIRKGEPAEVPTPIIKRIVEILQESGAEQKDINKAIRDRIKNTYIHLGVKMPIARP